MTGLLIRGAEVAGRPGVDVLVEGERIVAVGAELPTVGHTVVDADGGALLPGLHDHHLHLHALAADADSVRCGPPHVRDGAALAAALATAPGDGWIRGVGYVETVAGELDSAGLDALCRDRPVRVQHRSGAVWILNSAAAALVGLDSAVHPGVERDHHGRATGRVWRADTWLRSRLPETGPPDLTAIGDELARYGITGITDATPDLSETSLAALLAAAASRAIPQRLNLLGVALDAAVEPVSGVTVGAYKIVLADSGLPDIDALIATVARAHAADRPVAVHCVSREALLILLAVFAETGNVPGDRIEHGALIPVETLGTLRGLGLRVVTQPGFVAHRGDDYLQRVDAADLGDLYRCRSLCDAGIGLALSSDAPYGPLDPWRVIAAAADRRAPDGRRVGPAERITTRAALDLYLAPLDDPGAAPRVVGRGARADLVLLDRSVADQCAAPTAGAVRATVIGGRVAYAR
ncbi:amidohydrolase family protein [Rhodococcus sp. SGAir0479]|uniref:amidohydrolase family protein n=1 Tax=Rhodococcus sp. SGAir0479 TaxID=2567884 RepID=UPI0010CCBEA3|nr:amidohydrolase family protein [Rhodococcus sp. SGAir0479]QCQ92365.1 amidohydrolase [Rhodococcus sp. SGAir0479]